MVMIWERPRFDPASLAIGGEAASAGDVFNATVDAMRLTENANSRLVALDRAYDKRIDEVKEATGTELPNPVSSGYGGSSTMAGFGVQEETDPHAAFQQKMEELAEQHPDQRAIIAPDRPVLDDAAALAHETETKSEDTYLRSSGGLAPWAARLAGGFYGAMHDPVNVGTLALGPVAPAEAGIKGLLWMGVKQGVANAAGEALIQPSVQAWRKEAGLDYGLSRAVFNVAAAGAFGFGMDVGVRGAVRGVRRAIGKPYLGPEAAPEPTGARLPEASQTQPSPQPSAEAALPRSTAPSDPMAALERAAKDAQEGSLLRRAADGDVEAQRELAKAAGVGDDPVIRAALEQIEIDRQFPAPLDIDGGEHLETLARAIREQSGAADLPAGDAIIAPRRRDIAALADETPGRTLEVEGRPVEFRAVDPRQVATDASTFQFKSGGDAGGVTDRLRGVTRWDPLSAGKAIVFERTDGQLVIADGHQRLGLAKRLEAEGESAKLDAYIFREADGWTPEDVRAYAALKNMRESSGTSLDMAQVMRDRPDLIDGSLPLRDAKLREAAMLARLSPEAFDAVVAGRLPPHYAALIGESVADVSRHGGLLDEMAEAGLENAGQARLYLKQLLELPTTTETQMTLFGEESFTRTVLVERAQVLDSALKTLRTDKRVFALLEDQAKRIEGAGNVLAREANAAKAENAGQLADLIEKLATSRGTVASILNDAAASVARGLDSKLASRAFVDRIASVLEREGLPGLVKADEAPQPALAPVRMEDAIGPEAKAQTADIDWALELDDEIKFALRGGRADDFQGVDAQLQAIFDRWGEPLEAIPGRWDDGDPYNVPALRAASEQIADDISRATQMEARLDEIDRIKDTMDDSQMAAYDELTDEEEVLRADKSDIYDKWGAADSIVSLKARQKRLLGDVERAATLVKRYDELNVDDAANDAMFALRGFYSPAIRAAESITQEKGTGDQFLAQITKIPGVKKDELDWMGLEEFLKGKKSITKAEVLDFMRANQVELDEKVLGGKPSDKALIAGSITPEQFRKRTGASEGAFPDAEIQFIEEFSTSGETFYVVKRNDSPEYSVLSNALEDIGRSTNRAAAEHIGQGWAKSQDESPRFSGYKVPGGENYGELLIRLPEFGNPADLSLEQFVPAMRRGSVSTSREPRYKSKHFQDQEIAHLRVDDRVGPGGEKVLFINEVQSDLHQQGRSAGYETTPQQRIRDAIAKGAVDEGTGNAYIRALDRGVSIDQLMRESTREERMELGELMKAAVPNAPFKGDLWLELALKRALQYATENGYDAVSWARSDQIAKAVGAQPEKLALQYDQKIGKFFDKYTKKWGGKVETGLDIDTAQVPARRAHANAMLDALGDIAQAPDRMRAAAEKVGTNPLLQITPQMRASVAEGQALFARGASSAEQPRNATLRNTALSSRAADEMASIRGEIDKAIAKSLPEGWRAEVRQSLVFGDLSDRLQKRNPGVPPELAIEGTFDPYERIIYVSMAALDPVERAFEEAGHALKSMRLIPEADYAILRAKADEIGARQKFSIDERYGDVYGARWKDNPARLEEALQEEAIMQMVAARARGDDFGKASNGIIDRLIKFLRSVRDMLGLKGLRNFEDVFADMTEGGFAREADGQSAGGAARPVGGEMMAARAETGAGGLREMVSKQLTEIYDEFGVSSIDELRALKKQLPIDEKEIARLSDELDEMDADEVERIIREKYGDKRPDSVPYFDYESPPAMKALEERFQALLDKYKTDDPLRIEMLAPEIGRELARAEKLHARLVRGAERDAGKNDDLDPTFALPDPAAADAGFIARAQTVSEILFAVGDEGKGKTPEGEAAPAPERKAEAKADEATGTKTSGPIIPGGRESKRIRNLINQAAAEGRLSRDEAQALVERFDVLEQFHKDGGKARQQLAKEVTAEAEHRKRQKAIAEQRRRAISSMLIGFRDARGQSDPAMAMQSLIENLGQHELPQGFVDVAGHQRAIYGLALSDLDAMLAEFRKTLVTGQTRNKARLSNVVRELHGEKTGDELAASFAVAVAKVTEDLRQRFNAAGGNIAKRKDWHMPQSHDKVAMLKARKEPWVDFILPLLDYKWMKHPLTGDDLPPADARRMLGDVWDNLVSDGWHEREASMAFRGLSAIANTRADPRSLIFANAEAWAKYSKRFGAGDDALAVIVSHIRGMTKDIAAMEVLGPNPKAMLTYMGQFVEQQAKLRRAGMAAHFPTVSELTGGAMRAGGGLLARDPADYANAMIKRAENMWDIYSGAASAPVNASWAATSQTIRNVNVATKLGGATVSALSDVFWQVAARKFAGLPAVRIIGDMVKQIGLSGEREARRAGVIAETYLHLHNEGAREGAALSATKISAFVADRVLSLSMLNAVTRYGNHAMAMGIQAHLADMAAKAFGDLDPRLQRMFRRWGLEAPDWDTIRLDANGRAREVDFLSPADLRRQLVDGGGDPSIAERYLAMTLGEAQYATLTGSIRGQATMYGNLRAGTAQRELWSMFMQFKSFAVNLAILQIGRMAREFVSQGFWRGAQYAAYAMTAATIGGALIEQLQQLRNGKDPRDMTTAAFWGTAAIRSGGLSIWGDLLYASENRFGGGIASTIAGPAASSLQDILNLTYGSAKKAVLFSDNKERTNFGRQLAKTVSRYAPGSSIWYVRTAWERVLMDNLQRMLDPEAEASFRRKIQNARRDYKQEFWWQPGRGPLPQRLPQLGAAAGTR